MKKICVILGMSFLFLMGQAFAQQAGWSRLEAGVVGGLFSSTAENTDGSFEFGGMFLIGLHRSIGIFGTAEYAPLKSTGRPLGRGKMKNTLFSFGLSFRVLKGKFSPILMAGGSFLTGSFALEGENIVSQLGFEVEQSFDSTFGPLVGGGFDIALGESLRILFYGKYTFMKVNINVRVTDLQTMQTLESEAKNIKLNPWFIGVGLLYRF